MVSRLFWKIYWKLSGWKVAGDWPAGLTRAVIVVGPHTSSTDVIIGMAARAVIPIPYAHYLGKKELFQGPFGWFFKATGGVPVDRFSKNNMVEQVVEEFRKRAHFVLALSPEGTRKKVDRLKTGFWHIASKAHVPVIMAGMDYSKKQLVLSEPWLTGTDPEEDLGKLIRFFAPLQGKFPAMDMTHLPELYNYPKKNDKNQA